MKGLSDPEPLAGHHLTNEFDCGRVELNDWLRRFALQNQTSRMAKTFVVHRDGLVVGYFALAASSVSRTEAPERITKGMPHYPVPVILLARLAVDRLYQGKGLGSALLKDAMRRVATVSDHVGVRAVLVHAKDEEVRAWYEQFDFEPSPTDTLHLFLSIQDVREAISE